MQGPVFIGCAGWSLPSAVRAGFPPEGSHLQRYAARLGAVEINSSFHRPHSHATYARWAASVPDHFRFAVKVPWTITHEHRLRSCDSVLDEFLERACGLGPRLGCLLVQLPPSLAFDIGEAEAFFGRLRRRWHGAISAEPRHASWFAPPAQALLSHHQVAGVLADPVRHPGGERPGGWSGMAYLRLHGTPRMYYSSYERGLLAALARRIARAAREGQSVWCIFDNTAAGAAADNALVLQQALAKELE
ncbi:MAG: DUF72 domain-containing protein [Ramlibacter sp.]